MRRVMLSCVVAALVGAIVAGCGSSGDHAQRVALAALDIKPAQPRPPTPTPPPVKCANPYASLRPQGPMPSANALPAGSFMAKIRDSGHLIAGVDQNTLLFSYFDPLTGHLVGFEIDLLHQLSEAIFGNPNRVVFKAIDTQERVPAVQNSDVDVVVDAMTITCQRKQQVDFSTVYYNAGQKILVPSNSRVRSIKALGGKRVCVTKGSTSYDTLKREVPHPIAYTVPQRTDCLVALQEGKVAAITSDDSILLGFKAQDPDTKIVGPSFAPEPYGMAVNKAHPDFVRFLNGFLAEIQKNGTWHALYEKWLGKPVPAAPKPQYDG